MPIRYEKQSALKHGRHLLRSAAFSSVAVFVWKLRIRRPAGQLGAFQIRR